MTTAPTESARMPAQNAGSVQPYVHSPVPPELRPLLEEIRMKLIAYWTHHGFAGMADMVKKLNAVLDVPAAHGATSDQYPVAQHDGSFLYPSEAEALRFAGVDARFAAAHYQDGRDLSPRDVAAGRSMARINAPCIIGQEGEPACIAGTEGCKVAHTVERFASGVTACRPPQSTGPEWWAWLKATPWARALYDRISARYVSTEEAREIINGFAAHVAVKGRHG